MTVKDWVLDLRGERGHKCAKLKKRGSEGGTTEVTWLLMLVSLQSPSKRWIYLSEGNTKKKISIN